ncbi:sucrase ferredoxin [Paradevosia shaoguanensis]|uniref:sucrase ferredoxin n=1 Tax=Paradevosia shaoguanensis TaxID=1335043 RepID=UPI003C767335
MAARTFCTDLALERGEPHEGTALDLRRVLLLAVPHGQWRLRRTAVGLSSLLEEAQAYAYSKSAYALFMDKVEGRGDVPQLMAFPENQVLDGVDEETIAAAMRRWADGGEIGGRVEERTTILVCTDSRRDACCARYGYATYKALVAQADPDKFNILQCNHLGGCRFATSLCVQPNASRYGRLRPEQVPEFLETIGRGETYLPLSMGRIGLEEPQQVAELAARRFAVTVGGHDGATALSLRTASADEMVFLAEVDGIAVDVTVARRSFERHGNCEAVGSEPANIVSRWVEQSVSRHVAG